MNASGDMHKNQLYIDTEAAEALVAKQFPHYRGQPVTRLASAGTVNAIFRIGAKVTARFPLQRDDASVAQGKLEAEATAMAEFAQASRFTAPQPLGIGAPGFGYPMPWSLQNWLDGAVATPYGLASSEAFASDIAELIAALRKTDTRGRGFSGSGRGGALPVHDAWVATCLRNSVGLLDVERLGRLWQNLRMLPVAGSEVMSHKDLIPANLLVRDGRLAGVLDTGGFAPADRALDLVTAWHLFDASCRNLIRQRLGVGEVEWKRGAAWALQQALGLVWYYQTSNPPMAALGRSTLDRLLADELAERI